MDSTSGCIAKRWEGDVGWSFVGRGSVRFLLLLCLSGVSGSGSCVWGDELSELVNRIMAWSHSTELWGVGPAPLEVGPVELMSEAGTVTKLVKSSSMMLSSSSGSQ